jgi:hypothetical protein
LQLLESKINEVKISVLICENQWGKTVQLRFLLRRNDKVQRAAKSSATSLSPQRSPVLFYKRLLIACLLKAKSATFNPTYALA